MALKTIRTSIRLDREDLNFLQELGIFKNNSDGIRFAIKLMRLYSIPSIKAIKNFHNGNIPLEAFSVEYDNAGCPWWDNQSTEPRNLYAGGGGNVLIQNPNPSHEIVIRSKGKVIERRKLSEITLRA